MLKIRLKKKNLKSFLVADFPYSTVHKEIWSSYDINCRETGAQLICKKQYVHYIPASVSNLKGHGNEADFLGFLQKLVPHRSLTLPFKPFWFWLRIRGDFAIEKRLGDSPTRRVGESLTLRLAESGSRLPDWASRRVGFWMYKRKLGESESQSLAGEGAGGPNSDEGTDKVVL